MERFTYCNVDRISMQCYRALPDREGKDDVFIEAVRCILSYRVIFCNRLPIDMTALDIIKQ